MKQEQAQLQLEEIAVFFVKMKNNKKAQVTLFIIIGIVMIAAVATFLYIRNTIEAGDRDADIIRQIEEIPSELVPIRTFVESCIKLETEEALRIAGQHGGHVYSDSFASNIIEPTEGDALEYNPFPGYKVPYWYYMESDNSCTSDCSFKSNAPPLCRPGRG